MISIHDVAVVVAVPLEGPAVRLNSKPGRNEAELVWKEIPKDHRRGFITNYTIFYTNGTGLHSMYLSYIVSRIGSSVCMYSFLFSRNVLLTVFQQQSRWFLFCSFADKTVPGNVTSYTLKLLSGNTKYDTWIKVSTIRGSTYGFKHSFTTLKYGECNLSHMGNYWISNFP